MSYFVILSVCRVYSQPIGSSLKLYVSGISARDTGKYNCTGRVDNIPAHWSFELQAYGRLGDHAGRIGDVFAVLMSTNFPYPYHP